MLQCTCVRCHNYLVQINQMNLPMEISLLLSSFQKSSYDLCMELSLFLHRKVVFVFEQI